MTAKRLSFRCTAMSAPDAVGAAKQIARAAGFVVVDVSEVKWAPREPFEPAWAVTLVLRDGAA